MEESATHNDEAVAAVAAVAAYLTASEAALLSAQRLSEAWRRHFEANAEPPSADWIAIVAAQQLASDLALDRARAVAARPIPIQELAPAQEIGLPEPPVTRTKRRRRHENQFLATIGRPGLRLLRALVLIALVVSGLVATGAGISLALEIAGFLHLIDEPVQLPVGIQLAIFVVATAVAVGLKKALKPVERALYGSKGVRPKSFSL
jgi:hypothetical protein